MKFLKGIDKNLIIYLIGIGVIIFLFMFVVTSIQIGHDVKKRCEIAQAQYGGECQEALMEQIKDESKTAGKNDAIWALGQLGDKDVLPFLRQLDNGQPLPDHEPWNDGVSQYELRKAIKLLDGGFNATAFVWRN
jgi:hypothetical protein